METVKCNLAPCENKISKWREWSQWTACSRSCGPFGKKERKRTCDGTGKTKIFQNFFSYNHKIKKIFLIILKGVMDNESRSGVAIRRLSVLLHGIAKQRTSGHPGKIGIIVPELAIKALGRVRKILKLTQKKAEVNSC